MIVSHPRLYLVLKQAKYDRIVTAGKAELPRRTPIIPRVVAVPASGWQVLHQGDYAIVGNLA